LLAQEWKDADLLAAMSYDKKVRAETIRFALPAGIGTMAGAHSNWTVPVPTPIIREVLTTARSSATLY
jgi:3-dehydroquinate synthetase